MVNSRCSYLTQKTITGDSLSHSIRMSINEDDELLPRRPMPTAGRAESHIKPWISWAISIPRVSRSGRLVINNEGVGRSNHQ